MRNNRQHKKLSKQAMDLLISHYGYERDSFTLECEMGGKYRQEWHYWTAPCYWHGEQDQNPALSELVQNAIAERTDWTEAGAIYVGESLPHGDVALIRHLKRSKKDGEA